MWYIPVCMESTKDSQTPNPRRTQVRASSLALSFFPRPTAAVAGDQAASRDLTRPDSCGLFSIACLRDNSNPTSCSFIFSIFTNLNRSALDQPPSWIAAWTRSYLSAR